MYGCLYINMYVCYNIMLRSYSTVSINRHRLEAKYLKWNENFKALEYLFIFNLFNLF